MKHIIHLLFLVAATVACTPSADLESEEIASLTPKPAIPLATSELAETSVDPTPMGMGTSSTFLVPLPPTPILEQATDYVSGATSQEPGTYLFIERWSDFTGTVECEVYSFIDYPTYHYECAGRCPWEWGLETPDRPITRLFGRDLSERPIPALLIGMYGSGSSISGIGSGVASGLYPINSLPYDISDEERTTVIHNVAMDGSVVVQLGLIDVTLRSGQSWIHREYVDEAWLRNWYGDAMQIPSNCMVLHTERLTNFGLLLPEQIDSDIDLGAHLRLTPTPLPLLSGCTSYQPLGETGWVWDLAVGSNGQVWAATNRGVAHFDPSTGQWTPFTAADGLIEGTIRAVAIEESGAVWAANWDGGLSTFDGVGWKEARPDGLLTTEVWLVRVAPDGSLWFGSSEGIFHWDKNADVWRHYSIADGLHKNGASDILFTPEGTVWVTHPGAVSYLPPHEDRWLVHPQSEREQQELLNGYRTATVAPDGKIWFSGQRHYDPAEGQWTETVYGGSNLGFAYDVLVDTSGGLWVARGGTAGLIYIANPLTDADPLSWHIYNTDHGLGGNDVRSMAFGDEDTLWLGAEDGSVTRCHIESSIE